MMLHDLLAWATIGLAVAKALPVIVELLRSLFAAIGSACQH